MSRLVPAGLLPTPALDLRSLRVPLIEASAHSAGNSIFKKSITELIATILDFPTLGVFLIMHTNITGTPLIQPFQAHCSCLSIT